MSNALVLDSEAFSAAARRSPAGRHAVVHAALTAARNLGRSVVVPAAVLAEQYRSPAVDAPIDSFLARRGEAVVVVPTDREVARAIGHLLAAAGRGSEDHVDAAVVAVAAQAGRAVVLTGDRTDVDVIASSLQRVVVRHI